MSSGPYLEGEELKPMMNGREKPAAVIVCAEQRVVQGGKSLLRTDEERFSVRRRFKISQSTLHQ